MGTPHIGTLLTFFCKTKTLLKNIVSLSFTLTHTHTYTLTHSMCPVDTEDQAGQFIFDSHLISFYRVYKNRCNIKKEKWSIMHSMKISRY